MFRFPARLHVAELRSFLRIAGSLAVLLLVACTEHARATDPASAATPAGAGPQHCRVQVIVSFAQAAQNQSPPDDRLVQDLARVAGVNLLYLRSVTSELHLFSLSGVGDDCGKAVERLRGDPRVRSVDIDQRRQHH
jgi:hypothetical protein